MDAATKLYTAPLKDGQPLVLDLSGPLLWSMCAAAHPSYECHHAACAHAHGHHPPGCPRTGHSVADESDPFHCPCSNFNFENGLEWKWIGYTGLMYSSFSTMSKWTGVELN
jgi:hypothetical protein